MLCSCLLKLTTTGCIESNVHACQTPHCLRCQGQCAWVNAPLVHLFFTCHDFQMNCLRRICGISLRDHVLNVDILSRCNTFSVEYQLQSKRLRWLGHMFRIPDDRLLKKLLFGQVKGHRPPGCSRSSFNDVAVRDCQLRRITKPYKDAQNRMIWRDKTCLAHT